MPIAQGMPALETAGTAGVTASDIETLLRRADQARGSESGVVWDVTVTSQQRNRQENLQFNISSRGFDMLAVYTAPPRQRNAKLLMVNRNMWFHRPGLSKAIPISQRQRLLGMAAYGDLAATNYAEEYDAALIDEEELDGQRCLVFDLKARTSRASYDRIHYWVSAKSGLGIHSRFFTASGKAIKKARMEYENRIPDDVGGTQAFISRIIITDELISQNVTTIVFGEPDMKPIPDSVFDLNLLTQ